MKKNEVEKFCGWVLQCKTEEKVKKINFYKFILVYWRMRKKNGYNFFFCVFQSSSKKKKIGEEILDKMVQNKMKKKMR